MADAVEDHEDEDMTTVGSLMETLKLFPADMPVVVFAKMPIDQDHPENAGKSEDDLEEEHTIEVPIEHVEKIEYDEEDGITPPPVLGIFCDIDAMAADEEDEDDEESVDQGD